jgi:hypothetical protein
MNVRIKTIPHRKQRYDTPGDWWFTKRRDLEIRVSVLHRREFEWLIAIHELVEVFCCLLGGISQREVDAFDLRWEEERRLGLHGPVDEPGDDPEAPYHGAHLSATRIERMVAIFLGVSWDKYAKAVNDLAGTWRKR